jgi:hypothetical protein
MLDKQTARKLNPLVNNPGWEALKEHLNNLKTSELQVLVVATSEQEMYRSQGRVSSLDKLGNLKEQVQEALQRKEEK